MIASPPAIRRRTLTIDQFDTPIRRRGENLSAGQTAVPMRSRIHPPNVAAASFGLAQLRVYRRIRVGVIITRDELLPIQSGPQPWQIRDTNGPALLSLLATCPRTVMTERLHVPDVAADLQTQLTRVMDNCDLVLLTGGVSMCQVSAEAAASTGNQVRTPTQM